MNIAVVDDSVDDRKMLTDSIKKYATDNSLMLHLSEYESGEDFLANANILAVDAIFLDIYMNDINGMQVAKKIVEKNQNCMIIFETTSADYAIESYSVRAFYYLLKPYSCSDIFSIMALLEKSAQKSSRYIKVKESREWYKILLSDILYADYSNHYVQIHTKTGIVSTYMKFSEFESMLSQYNEFLSCYRCILINMNKIKKIDGLFFLLTNGEYIPINRKQSKEIKACYAEYVFNAIEGNAQMSKQISNDTNIAF